ncbi:MAG: restriction endonuclease subunit S [Elusimicrobiaceae bacterium]|nr:restriction endonuclease subunit S [Elusimicrobiaceae bacterium]
MKTPNNWLSIALGNMSTFIRGVTFPKGSRLESYENETVAVATTKAAQQPGIEHDKLYFIPKSFVKRLEQFLLPNDIVISIANSLDLVGRVTFATKKDEGITWGAFLGVIRANPKLIYPYFLYSFLTTAETKQYFRKNARTTTNISNISSDSILSLQIPVPPLAEQKRIVKKIEELFGVIDEQVKRLEATQEALVSYRQSVLNAYFRNSNYPKCKIKDFIVLKNGYAFDSKSYQNAGIPVVRISNITTNRKVFLDNAVYVEDKQEYQNFIVSKGDLLLAMSGATTGKLGIYEENVKAFQNQRVGNLKIIDKTKCLSKFRNYLFFSLSDAILHLAYGGAQPNISGTKLLNLTSILPSIEQQRDIVKKIETAFAFADKAQAAITNALEQAKQLKQSILKRAFEGKLVPQDPNDKPIDLTQLKKDKQK